MYNSVAVAAAMERELASLRTTLVPSDAGKPKIAFGTVAGKDVCLLRTGIGPAKTRKRLSELEQVCRPRCIVSIGCAGALDSSLTIGEAIVADKLFDDLDGRVWPAAPDLVEKAYECCRSEGIKCRTGSTVSTGAAAENQQQKEKLAQKYGALAVDMESAHIASWAANLNIPMVCVRTISDRLTDVLPPGLSAVFDRDGNVRPASLLVYLLTNPLCAYRAFQLKTNFSQSMSVLARIVHPLLANL